MGRRPGTSSMARLVRTGDHQCLSLQFKVGRLARTLGLGVDLDSSLWHLDRGNKMATPFRYSRCVSLIPVRLRS